MRKKNQSFPEIVDDDEIRKMFAPDTDEDVSNDAFDSAPDGEWTLTSAANFLVLNLTGSQLRQSAINKCKKPLDYLTSRLPFSARACILLSFILEIDDVVDWGELAEKFRTTRLKVMSWSISINELIEKRWVLKEEDGFRHHKKGFRLANGVIDAFYTNEVFQPENLHCDTIADLIHIISDKISECKPGFVALDYTSFENSVHYIFSENTHLPFVRTALAYHDKTASVLLAWMAADYAEFGETDNEGLFFSEIDESFPNEAVCKRIRKNLTELTHPLMTDGLIEPDCQDSIVDTTRILFTSKAKEELLENYVSPRSAARGIVSKERSLRACKDIAAKRLFYHPDDCGQVDQLASLLSVDNFNDVQKRLSERGLRNGFACLFYGAPGTGKTETVLQIARQTGRDIFLVDISNIRDKFVGESEKNIKSVFRRYRKICDNSTIKPILLFNEADAIFGRRTTNVERSVDQMNNSIQNIILQEMEDLDGILIATTNLTANLDAAFERRFIFKLEFHKPDIEAKSHIWQSLIQELSDTDAHTLASEFDFSGGQIENISRKCLVDYVLHGQTPDIGRLRELCRSETITRNANHRVIGF